MACIRASDFSSRRTIGSFRRSGTRVLCGRVHASSWDEVRIDSTRGTRFFNSTSFTKPSSTAKPLRAKSVWNCCSHKLAGDALLSAMAECDPLFRFTMSGSHMLASYQTVPLVSSASPTLSGLPNVHTSGPCHFQTSHETSQRFWLRGLYLVTDYHVPANLILVSLELGDAVPITLPPLLPRFRIPSQAQP